MEGYIKEARLLNRRFCISPCVIAILFLTIACRQSFPENPALSKNRKYNLSEIRILRENLGSIFISRKREAIIKGMLWTLDFVQDNNNFKFIFRNYIPMLYEISVIGSDDTIRDVARRLIRNEAARGEKYIEEEFDENTEEDLVLIIGILGRVNAPADRYIERQRKSNPGYDGENCRDKFYRAVQILDYDKLTDALSDYSHFRFSYGPGRVIGLRVPKDYRDEFIRVCSDLPFKYSLADRDGYHDQNYFATHAIFAMTGYGEYPLPDNRFARRLKRYINDNFPTVYSKVDDIDLLGEYVECMKIIGLGRDELVHEAEERIIRRQGADGSWTKTGGRDNDPYDLFHPAWTSITALLFGK